jgi:SAM-dependent MidA family methyltransferase
MVTPATDSRDFSGVFTAASAGRPMSFARFMELALYHPAVGYYRRNRRRTGLAADTDFHTSVNLGPLFGELVVAAAIKLAGPADWGNWTFVEIGAEPDRGVLDGVAHPFGRVAAIRVGEPLNLAGPCVVFSNELFDAQPFHRLRWRDGAWRETGVTLTADRRWVETELAEWSPEVRSRQSRLPATAPSEDYRLDLPLAAEALCGQIADQSWTGLFLAFDYGKSWLELAEALPAGTARAYRAHRQEADLLAYPGEQDLTCHICWDWLEAVLGARGFSRSAREGQEAFFLRHATDAVERIVRHPSAGPDPLKSRLQQLLHPALQGQRFQVLHALRH